MIVTLEQLLAPSATAAGRDAKRLERKAERTGVHPVPLTEQDRTDALTAKREGREDRARRRVARRATGKHRKG